MGKKVLFLDSVLQDDGSYSPVYSAADINQITKNITGGGIAPFVSDSTYSTTELNSLTQAIVQSGTSLDGLKVTYNAEGQKINIAQGICFFDNGASMSVDSEGVSLPYTAANITYVYAKYDEALNTCDFYADTTAPPASDASAGIYVVKLATVGADGAVEDLRTLSKIKVASDAPHTTETVHVSITDGELEAVAAGELVKSYQLKSASYSVLSYYTDRYRLAVFDINTGVYGYRANDSFASMDSPGAFNLLTRSSSRGSWYIKVKIEGNRLNFYKNAYDEEGITADFIFH